MSESEYTGPRCAAVLFPVSRRKLSMRPLTSSSFPIEGILAVTFVSRRGDQNPASIVTACTGTLRSFAYGDLAKFRIPWSRQAGVVVSATEFCSRPPKASVNPLKVFCAPGSTEIAEADIAEVRNFLREYFPFMVTLPAASLRSHGAHHSATQVRRSRSRYGGYFFSQYPCLSTFFLENSNGRKPGFPVVFRHRKSPAVGWQMASTDLSSSSKPHVHARVSLRKPLRCGFAIVLCSCLFFGAAQCRAQASQDVAEAARQERAHKDRAKKQKHVYTDEDLRRAKILTPDDEALVEAKRKQQPTSVQEQAQSPIDADTTLAQLPLGDIARRYRNAKLAAQTPDPFHLPFDEPVFAAPVISVPDLEPPRPSFSPAHPNLAPVHSAPVIAPGVPSPPLRRLDPFTRRLAPVAPPQVSRIAPAAPQPKAVPSIAPATPP